MVEDWQPPNDAVFDNVVPRDYWLLYFTNENMVTWEV